jgi:hypothetical protein
MFNEQESREFIEHCHLRHPLEAEIIEMMRSPEWRSQLRESFERHLDGRRVEALRRVTESLVSQGVIAQDDPTFADLWRLCGLPIEEHLQDHLRSLLESPFTLVSVAKRFEILMGQIQESPLRVLAAPTLVGAILEMIGSQDEWDDPVYDNASTLLQGLTGRVLWHDRIYLP